LAVVGKRQQVQQSTSNKTCWPLATGRSYQCTTRYALEKHGCKELQLAAAAALVVLGPTNVLAMAKI
jgi:hypothetical protein